jgi:hypothetical protein
LLLREDEEEERKSGEEGRKMGMWMGDEMSIPLVRFRS